MRSIVTFHRKRWDASWWADACVIAMVCCNATMAIRMQVFGTECAASTLSWYAAALGYAALSWKLGQPNVSSLKATALRVLAVLVGLCCALVAAYLAMFNDCRTFAPWQSWGVLSAAFLTTWLRAETNPR